MRNTHSWLQFSINIIIIIYFYHFLPFVADYWKTYESCLWSRAPYKYIGKRDCRYFAYSSTTAWPPSVTGWKMRLSTSKNCWLVTYSWPSNRTCPSQSFNRIFTEIYFIFFNRCIHMTWLWYGFVAVVISGRVIVIVESII